MKNTHHHKRLIQIHVEYISLLCTRAKYISLLLPTKTTKKMGASTVIPNRMGLPARPPPLLSRNAPRPTRIRVVEGGSPPPQVEITWQIAVGALAGVTPFIVAGVEFGKRIVAQRKCATCGGSGLVQREGYYFRCPGCGGFLPWQSWKRFFTG